MAFLTSKKFSGELAHLLSMVFVGVSKTSKAIVQISILSSLDNSQARLVSPLALNKGGYMPCATLSRPVNIISVR